MAMVPFCQQHGIQLLPYGVLAGGLLTDRYLGAPLDSVRLDTYSKQKYASVIREAGGWSWFQVGRRGPPRPHRSVGRSWRLVSTNSNGTRRMQDLLRVLRRIADKHETSIANVATRWVLDRPTVAGVILGARNASHVADHVSIFERGLILDQEDMGQIAEVLARGRQARNDCYTWERGGGW